MMKLPIEKAIIYSPLENELKIIKLKNMFPCNIEIVCGTFIDKTGLTSGENNTENERVITIQTYGNNIYGWSDGDVGYTIE